MGTHNAAKAASQAQSPKEKGGDYLVELLAHAAEAIMEYSGRPDKMIALRNLAAVVRDRPELSAVLQQGMAKKLREMAETSVSADPMDTTSATAIRNRRLAAK